MKPDVLKSLITRLIDVEPDESPMISCFVNLEQPRSTYYSEIEMKAREVAKQLKGQALQDYEDALAEIRDYLETALNFGSKGVAIYSRWGEKPILVPVQFEVPLESEFIVDSVPHIYPLIELKDTYNRFIIVIANEKEARIIETTIGAVTEEIVKKRSDYRKRMGREWSRDHYRNHRSERSSQYVKEKIEVIDDLVTRRGHNHLILAGSPKMVARMKSMLPPRLERILISTVSMNPRAGVSPILLEAIHEFAEAEQKESHTQVHLLQESILSGGLAVAGYEASCEALRDNRGDLLIIDQDFEDLGMREELIRLASAAEVPIETVKGSETLEQLGGVGCLLRYRKQPNGGGEASIYSAA